MDITRLRALAGINNNNQIQETTNTWQRLAGITTELLQEAREDTINNSQGHKLWEIYNKKQDNINNINDSLSLIKYISSNSIPKFIQWIITTYINDPNFKLNQLDQVTQTLEQYQSIISRKGQQQIDPQITNFKTIDELINKINEIKGEGNHKFNSFTVRFYEAMIQTTQQNQAHWVYRSPSLCIWSPKNHKAAESIRQAHPDKVKLCTTFINDPSYYNKYARSGRQYYILLPDTLILMFIKTRPHSPQQTEIRDYKNNDQIQEVVQLARQAPDIIQPLVQPMIDQIPLKIQLLLADATQSTILKELAEYSVNTNQLDTYTPKSKTFALALKQELIDVYDRISNDWEQLLINHFPDDIIQEVFKFDNNEKNITNEFILDIRPFIIQTWGTEQPITSRDNFMDIISTIIDYIFEQNRQFAEQLGIDPDHALEELLDNQGRHITSFNSTVDPNFPTFTDPNDVQQWAQTTETNFTDNYGIMNSFLFLPRHDEDQIGMAEIWAYIQEHEWGG